MTQEEIVEFSRRMSGLSPEQVREEMRKHFSWDYPGCVFLPERYYLGLWYVELPPQLTEFRKGGSFMAQLWRFDDTPDEWILTCRFRHYFTSKISDPRDVRRWRAMRNTIHATEDEILADTKKLASMIAGIAVATSGGQSAPWQFVELRGDATVAMHKLAEAAPEWWQPTGHVQDGKEAAFTRDQYKRMFTKR